MDRRSLLRIGLAAPFALSALRSELVNAQGASYPTKPVQLIVAIQAGGGIDLAARMTAEAASAKLGQPFIVENRAGAGGLIGMTDVSHAKPDGYTLFFGTAGPLTILPQRATVAATIDPLKAFRCVALLYSVPLVVIAKKNGRFKTLRELVDFAKKNPGQVSYGSTGVGSINHLVAELFSSQAGVKLLHVPYKGTGPIVTDMIGDRVDLYFATLPSWKSTSDKLTVLAVASKKRSEVAAEFPTSAEAGLPGFEFDNWGGVFVPSATPQPIIDKLRQTFDEAMKDPKIREKFKAVGNEPDFRAGAEARAEIETSYTKMKNLVRERQLNLEP